MAARGAYETTPVYSLMKSLRIYVLCTVNVYNYVYYLLQGKKLLLNFKK